jgi:Ca2+-binding RTX toxin-like protein
MALGFLNAGPTGFRFGEYIGGVFYGVIVTGVGLTYDMNGVPVGGTLIAMEFTGTLVQSQGDQSDVGRIAFPKGMQVATLTNKGFDWFASASTESGALVIDATLLLTKIDKLNITALPRWMDGSYNIANITTGNQADRITAISDDYLMSMIESGAGKDRINVAGFSTYIEAGADKDVIMADVLIAAISGESGDDIMNIVAISADVMGGADDDTITLSMLDDQEVDGYYISARAVVDGGTGHDRIQVYGSEGYEAQIEGEKGNDTILGSDAGSELFYGQEGHDVLNLGGVGSEEVDIGSGGAGNDQIISGDGAGTAILLGGAGNDSLIGGSARNYLWGGDGNDFMIGNGGGDIYVLDRGTDLAIASEDDDYFVFVGQDRATQATIIGFDTSVDVLMIDSGNGLSGADSFDLFLALAVQVGDDVLYNDGQGSTLLLRDVQLDELSLINFIDDGYDRSSPPYNDSY